MGSVPVGLGVTSDAYVHLRIPAAVKGRWIRASRAAGMRLTDWIVAHTEAAMVAHTLRINIPATLAFADLRLRRESDGDLSFDTAPLTAIAEASGDPVAQLLEHEDGVATVITGWYRVARARGEPADPVAEDLAAEVAAEDAAGQGVSLPPGRA